MVSDGAKKAAEDVWLAAIKDAGSERVQYRHAIAERIIQSAIDAAVEPERERARKLAKAISDYSHRPACSELYRALRDYERETGEVIG